MAAHKQVASMRGFTIVELLIVIVVIAILAAVTIVAYTGISARADEARIQANVSQIGTKLEALAVTGGVGEYPDSLDDLGIELDENATYQYRTTGNGADSTYCVSINKGSVYYYVSSRGSGEGLCTIQLVTTANCPTTRTLAIDARDEHTYWVQKFSDGKCWMNTNLSYAGGGDDIYGDTVSLNNGTGKTVANTLFTVTDYYIPTGANPTVVPQEPSTSTDGTGQYGYLYTWCGALGGQLSTEACTNLDTPSADYSVSICPSGWTLPTTLQVVDNLRAAINGGLSTTDAGAREKWLGQYSGLWHGTYSYQGVSGWYWTRNTKGGYATVLRIASDSMNQSSPNKPQGAAVRCVAV